MKVILRTDVKLGSGTITDAYIPRGGAEFATDEAYAKAKEILSVHRGKLDFVSEFLVKNEIMDDEQFNAAMEAEAPTQEEIEAIGEAKRRRSDEENKLREAAEAEARRRDEEEARRRAEEEKAKANQNNGQNPFFS